VRALAVAGVLAFHGGVSWLPGGFLGVDAFFVLSGYLITGLLLAEHAREGRVRWVAFWVRRARRLLPALLVVVAAVAVGARFLLPPAELRLVRGDALSALGYVANWRMITRGGDYFADTASPSPLMHTWSLAIEEQFYLAWPVLLVGVLAVRRSAGAVLAASALGIVASTGVMVVLAAHGASAARLYQGTDTRVASLLVGAALAALLAREPVAGAHSRRRLRELSADGPARRRVLGGLALAGAAVTAWSWTAVDGADPLLYRGGLLVAALAVAAVLAAVALAPEGAASWLLALPPLPQLGRISYGVYLWHWPLFGVLTADRTGLHGAALLAVRCVATIAIATVSYVLVEQPVRRGRWWSAAAVPAAPPRPRRRVPAALVRPALTRAAAGLVAVAAAAVTVVAATSPPGAGQGPPDLDALAGGAAPAEVPAGTPTTAAPSLTPGSPSPSARPTPRRPPGSAPKVSVLGDSVAWTFAQYLPPHPGIDIRNRTIPGCGIARLSPYRYFGGVHRPYPKCPGWDGIWRRAVQYDQPDVAMILLGRWETMDRTLNGRWQHIGQPEYDAYLTRELELAVSIAASQGAHVVLATSPYSRRGERPDGGLYDEDRPERMDLWNALLRRVAARHPGIVTVVDLARRACPDGRFTWSVGGLRLRSDGLHFTPRGVQRWIAPWLLPQLRAIAVRRR